MESPRSRSPLKLKALRLPGQSLDQAMERLLWEELRSALLFALICIILAGFEWFGALRELPPQPGLFTSLAVIALLYAARKFVKVRTRVRHTALGRDGGRIVAEELDKLRASSAEVIHDVPAPWRAGAARTLARAARDALSKSELSETLQATDQACLMLSVLDCG